MLFILTIGAGSYYAIVTNAIVRDNLTLYSDTVTVTNFSGKEDFVADKKQKVYTSIKALIYPNPAKDLLNISLAVFRNETAQVQIIDINGKSVLNQNVNLSSGTSTQTINVSKFAKGNYFINIKTDEENNCLKFLKE